MEKTVIVLAANQLSTTPCGDTVNIDVNVAKSNKACTETFSLCKTFWCCCSESVTDYCRVILDLFPTQHLVCVIASDMSKCLAINTWRDEDQELEKILAGLQNFGMPQYVSQPPRHHLDSVQKGLAYAVRCLVDLSATQYAVVTTGQHELPSNRGRIILLAPLKSVADVSKLESILVEQVKSENINIHQSRATSQDIVYRLPIAHCELVVVNMFAPTIRPHPITDAPLTMLCPEVSRVVYSFPAKLLKEKLVSLAKAHFSLATTIITGIPMKEEQVGGSSANYDVELLHHSDTHRDILRAGYQSSSSTASPIVGSATTPNCLKWATPRSTSLDMQFCTSAYRVTPVDVMARPTVCLVNFVLSGKSVLLEQAKPLLGKVVSHILTNQSGTIFLQSIPSSRSLHEDSPSISEGWGGKVSDYRIADFGQVMLAHKLVPHHINRTIIPAQLPIEAAIASIKRQTQFWPITFGETLLFSLQEELQPIVSVYRHEFLTEEDYDKCHKVIVRLQAKEANNEPLFPAVNTRSKNSKRDEHYSQLWGELQSFMQTYNGNSDKHWKLFELLLSVMTSSPSCIAHKLKTESAPLPPQPAVAESKNVANLAWSELDRYQGMTERERKELITIDRPKGGGWGGVQHEKPTPPQPPTGEVSFLALWNVQAKTAANKKHDEFAGRLKYGNKAELYKTPQQPSVIPMDTEGH